MIRVNLTARMNLLYSNKKLNKQKTKRWRDIRIARSTNLLLISDSFILKAIKKININFYLNQFLSRKKPSIKPKIKK